MEKQKYQEIEFSEQDIKSLEYMDWDSIYTSLGEKEGNLKAKLNMLLDNIESTANENYSYELADNCRDVVINSILGPFGLSKAMFDDKRGGTVTTPHNASKDIYSRPEEKYTRKHYDFSAKQRENAFEMNKREGVNIDVLTGKPTTDPNYDHFTAAKKYHQEYGWMQNAEERHSFGIDPNNLNVTDASLNKSMGESDKYDYESQQSSRNPDLTNKEDRGLDNRRVNAAAKRSEKAVLEHAPSTIECVMYHGKQLAKEGGATCVKMAIRQALGMTLKIFVEESFQIIKSAIKAYKEGLITGVKSFITFIVEGLKNIQDKISSYIEQIGNAAMDGGISGLVSTLVTFLINSFITTAKRIVTIIREISLSIIQAVRVLADKSKTKEERLKAAGLILTTAITTCVSIFLVELISDFLKTNIPFLGDMNDDVAQVIVSIIVGLIGVVCMYLFVRYKDDKLRKKEISEKNMKLDEIRKLSIQLMDISTKQVQVQLNSVYDDLRVLCYLVVGATTECTQNNLQFNQLISASDELITSISETQSRNRAKILMLKNKYSNEQH